MNKVPSQPLEFADRDEWRLWLSINHATCKEAWLVIRRRHATRPGLFLSEAVEEALCFGWIDGSMKSSSAESFVLRFSPRKLGSIWSVINQKRVESLIAQGKMTETGMAKVRAAQANGEWQEAIRRAEPSEYPEDLRIALERNPAASANYARLPASQKKLMVYWIESAKTEKTRLKRLQQVVEMAANNRRIGQ